MWIHLGFSLYTQLLKPGRRSLPVQGQGRITPGPSPAPRLLTPPGQDTGCQNRKGVRRMVGDGPGRPRLSYRSL
eukprot:101180-Hanusia_phi.AAC.1